ncbi:hypothetical protein CYMTET_56903 [Cymbomonas tetramitiformis]|uniref:Formate/nitrite transporter n=1 Tax=Cymbomonas tetramitiformis TaxID=36881 RepID=A0AAE0BBH3_9CHLO|nr:hypothetical protein CYMTET_56903 [Cymbomonas tetramitiformis]
MKSGFSASKTLVLGFMAGCFISLGASLCLSVGAQAPGLAASNGGIQKFVLGAIGLPFGLSWVIGTGSELFTGNAFVMAAGVYSGKVSMKDLAHNWFWSLLGNIIGCAFIFGMYIHLCGNVGNPGLMAGAAKVAMVRMTTTPILFFKAILCNWLVCLAIWLATASATLPGKYMSVFLCIPAFVAMGLEHSIANMFLVPAGMAAGAPITVAMFLTTLVPVLLGNIVGGAVFMGGLTHLAYGDN